MLNLLYVKFDTEVVQTFLLILDHITPKETNTKIMPPFSYGNSTTSIYDIPRVTRHFPL